jgi:hypothetical protein
MQQSSYAAYMILAIPAVDARQLLRWTYELMDPGLTGERAVELHIITRLCKYRCSRELIISMISD